MFLKAKRRPYFPVLIIEVKLRAAPERTSPGGHGGRGRFELKVIPKIYDLWRNRE